MTAPRPLLERAAELSVVNDVLDRVIGGAGTTVLFEGPAGIGKTSLLAGARAAAEERGFIVASARGSDLEQEYSWGVVRQLFERHAALARAVENSPPAAGSALALITDVGAPGKTTPQGEYALIHALFWLATDLAVGQQMVLIADDLHWSDLPSLRCLAYLAARLEGFPLAIIGALRPRDNRVEHVVSVMAGAPTTILRTLAPLTEGATATFLSATLKSEVDGGLAARCYDLTRGNPLLLRELGRQLAATGDGHDLDKVLEHGVPTVARYVGLQLNRLSARARTSIAALSVLGDKSPADRIATVAGLSTAEVMNGLSDLLAGELVSSIESPGQYSILHPLIRKAVYDEIPPAEKAQLHERSAHAAMKGRDVELAAAHLLRVPPGFSRLDVTAVLEEAANACLSRGSVDGAIAYLRRELDEDLGEHRLTVLTRLGMAEVLVDAAQAREHLSKAFALETEQERRAHVALALAGATFFEGKALEALRLCQAVLAQSTDLSLSSRRMLQSWMVLLTFLTPTAAELAGQIETLRAERPDPSLGGRMLDGVLALRDAFENRRLSAQERALRAIDGDIVLAHPLAESPLSCAWAALNAVDAPESLTSLDAAVDNARRNGSLRDLAVAICYRSAFMLALGNLDEAISDGRIGMEAAIASSARIGVPFCANYLLQALVARGQLDAAESVYRQLKALVPPDLPSFVYADGELSYLTAVGLIDQATERAQMARRDCESYLVRNPMSCDWRYHLVVCLRLQARNEEAGAISAQAMAMAKEWGTPRALGRALRLVAMTEPMDRQVELLDESVRVLSGSPAKLELARSLHAFGDALRRAREVSRARSQLRAAVELAEVCGAEPLRLAVVKSLRLIGSRAARTAKRGPEALTAGERRVTELAVNGLSNSQIAQSLFVTVKTVEVHLTNAFRKLDIGSRRELRDALNKTH